MESVLNEPFSLWYERLPPILQTHIKQTCNDTSRAESLLQYLKQLSIPNFVSVHPSSVKHLCRHIQDTQRVTAAQAFHYPTLLGEDIHESSVQESWTWRGWWQDQAVWLCLERRYMIPHDYELYQWHVYYDMSYNGGVIFPALSALISVSTEEIRIGEQFVFHNDPKFPSLTLTLPGSSKSQKQMLFERISDHYYKAYEGELYVSHVRTETRRSSWLHRSLSFSSSSSSSPTPSATVYFQGQVWTLSQGSYPHPSPYSGQEYPTSFTLSQASDKVQFTLQPKQMHFDGVYERVEGLADVSGVWQGKQVRRAWLSQPSRQTSVQLREQVLLLWGIPLQDVTLYPLPRQDPNDTLTSILLWTLPLWALFLFVVCYYFFSH